MEVSRDEFGGYCCKKWESEFEIDSQNICQLLGLDIEKMARELIQNDNEKKFKKFPAKGQREEVSSLKRPELLEVPAKTWEQSK